MRSWISATSSLMTRSRAPLDEEFAPWLDTTGDSSDDETEDPSVQEYTSLQQTSASTEEIDKLSEIDDWDPVRFEHEEASSQCLLRIQDDMLDLFENQLPGVCIQPMDISRFHVCMVGPSGTPHEGGCLYFLLQCPRDYPTRPPRVRLLNPDDGSCSPNLRESGKVCLDILGTTDASTWSPAHSIKSVLVAIQSLLTEP
ncbi:hypothetical protein MTO96_011167 [Rhipicephalus appendiculatus]